ncbi:M24 family metallopeptidase [Halomarina halobia]|uniref:M24 family metallopeptidase n=1 Tax=Halomarina halobia TaxID=3033386 RepID=A0ABD6AE87_9EURY|nr:Xaa-Pro peptidase family protein [Halomarina sp. PSR21]
MTRERRYDRTVAYERDVDEHRHEYPEFGYERRLAALAAALDDADVDGAVLPNYIDLTYFAGSGQPMNLYVPAGSPEAARVFVRRGMGFAEQEVGLPDQQVRHGGLSALAEYVSEVGAVGTVGLPTDVVPVSLGDKLAEALDATVVGISDLLLDLRAVKSGEEIGMLKTAATLYEHAHAGIRARAAPGVTEKEVAGAVSDRLVSAGMDDRVFFRRWDARLPAAGLIASGDTLPLISGHAMTITGTGTSRSMPWGPSNRRLEAGDFLVADLALNYAGYHGDVARTYVVGEATEEQREWFDLTLAIHEAARDAIEPGVAAETPYLAARERAVAAGVEDWLCGYAEMQAPYIGHGIGLEVDEEPTLMQGNTEEIEEGMVVTVEPKLVHPDRGAVMIEDDYLVTATGVERLSTMPHELFEIPVDAVDT